MKKITKQDVKIPTWALCYIINGDSSGLENAEIEMINKYFAPLDNDESINYHVATNNDETYFSSMPAFGSPCDVSDCTIVKYKVG